MHQPRIQIGDNSLLTNKANYVDLDAGHPDACVDPCVG